MAGCFCFRFLMNRQECGELIDWLASGAFVHMMPAILSRAEFLVLYNHRSNSALLFQCRHGVAMATRCP